MSQLIMTTYTNSFFKLHIAVTNEHGSWALLLSPLLIGLFAGGQLTPASIFLVAAALIGFLIRHPILIIVKIYSGRRSRRDLPAAVFWSVVYGLLGLIMMTGLAQQGFGYLILLAVPGILIFVWQLVLVSRRSERRQMGVEIVGTGVLALTAPAAMWVGIGEPVSLGWLLWILVWLQSAASIVYAYLRLEQRQLKEAPELPERIRMAQRALTYSTFNVVVIFALALGNVVSLLLAAPYLVQWGESIWGSLRPAVGVRPTSIGLRQTIVTSLFTVLFILAW